MLLLLPTNIMSDDQCARGPNGELLDASQIQFFFDPDDNEPLPAVMTSTFQPSEQPKAASEFDSPMNALSILMENSGQKPAVIAAGLRRSGRAIKLSDKLREAAATGSKRSAERSAESHTVRRRCCAIMDSEDEGDTSPPPTEALSEPERIGYDAHEEGGGESDTEAAYQKTKALGDADRAVRPCLSL
jgi:hypothetical protein